MTDYDVIGDIHGYDDVLRHLLTTLGYRDTRGAWRHPTRTAVFVGDLIDRGPGQLETLEIVRSMVEASTALMVLGNHEFNAVAYATRRDDGEWARPHTVKNQTQHAAFLAAVGEGSATHAEWVQWFTKVPMWLDLGGIRVVHACWHTPSMTVLGDGKLDRSIVTARAGDAAYDAIETVLKGPEISITPLAYVDKDGNQRTNARMRWWDIEATTLQSTALIPPGSTTPDGDPFGPLPDTAVPPGTLAGIDRVTPVLYGHYWRSGTTPDIDNPRSACLDWSVAKDGPLVGYRWSGEPALTSANLVAVR